MPMIRHETTTSILRLYKHSSDLPTPPFDATCMVTWESPRVVWIKAFHGELNRSMLRCLLEWLADNHVHTVKAYRDSAHSLPFGQLQHDGSTTIDVASLIDRFVRRTASAWGDLPDG